MVTRTLVRRFAVAVAIATLTTACGGAATTTTQPTLPTTATAVPGTPTASQAATLPVFPDGEPRPVPAGSYVSGSDNLFPGLAITIPDGWTATELDAGEIGLHPVGHSDQNLELWTDMAAVVTNNRTGTVGTPIAGIGRGTKDIVTWLTTTTDFRIVEPPAEVTIGQGIHGTRLTITTSDTADFGWDDCPDNPHCAAILTRPGMWNNFWAIGGKELATVFLTDVGADTFYVVIDAPDPATLDTLTKLAQPIVDSLRLP